MSEPDQDGRAAVLGEHLRRARNARGWSLRDAERHTGIPNAHLSQIETGAIRRPDLRTLLPLAAVYGIPLAVLMTDAGYPGVPALGDQLDQVAEAISPPAPELARVPWRPVRHVGRTVYAVTSPEASREDVLIGVMDTPGLADEAVRAHNAALEP
jgi:transcriptional regulator with XRE-family HTH domain